MGLHVTKTEQFTVTKLEGDHCAVKKSVRTHKNRDYRTLNVQHTFASCCGSSD
jgi:hypothetical protein